MQRRVTALDSYLLAWGAIGATLLLAGTWLAAAQLSDGTVEADLFAAIAVLLLVVVIEARPLEAPVGGTTMAFHPLEAVVMVSLVLLPAGLVPIVFTAGTAVGQVARRSHLRQAGFNTAVAATSASVAAGASALLIGVLPPDPATPIGAGVLVTAGVSFGVCNGAIMARLLQLLEPERQRRSFRAWIIEASAALVLSVSLGVVATIVIAVAPWASPVLLVAGWLVYRVLGRGGRRAAREAADRERLERTVAGASDGICLLAGDGTIELLNPAAERLLGVVGPDALGERLGDLLALTVPLDDPVIDDRLDECTPEDAVHRFDLQLGPRTIQVDLTGLFETRTSRSQRRVASRTSTVVLLRDVSDARERESLQREFVARASHELRTPLTAIIGSAELLRSHGHRLELGQTQALTSIISRQGRRLLALVEDLLVSARLEAGQITSIPEPFALMTVATEAVTAIRLAMDDCGPIEIDVRDVVVHADPGHVERILTNLLANAVKYGGPPIVLGAQEVDGSVRIEVSDGGPGVPSDFLPRLFTSFAQASVGDRREASGLGLGLAIVASLAEANGGSVDHVREQGRTCFNVILPADRAADAAVAEDGQTRQDPAKPEPFPREG